MTNAGGYKYILHVVDHFSKFLWALKTKRKDSQNVIQLLSKIAEENENKLNIVHSDNGGEFTSSVVKILVEKIGGEQVFGKPYHPQSQGSVERLNATIKRCIAKVCFIFLYNIKTNKMF